MTVQTAAPLERLIKSTERVRDLAEVFTPGDTVQTMLDLLPESMWEVHPPRTFLEPACGDGNFIVAVLDRKLRRVSRACADATLPAGSSANAVRFHALEALASIYAFDISRDNVVGGTPGHEVGARERLLRLLDQWFRTQPGHDAGDEEVMRVARWIVQRNIQVGDMLPRDVEGTTTNRDDLPLHEYIWMADRLEVLVTRTTLGAVAATEASGEPGVFSLFLPPEPTPVWSGYALDLHKAEAAGIVLCDAPIAHAR